MGSKRYYEFIDRENRLLRPKNLFEPSPGKGFEIYKTENIAVLHNFFNIQRTDFDCTFNLQLIQVI